MQRKEMKKNAKSFHLHIKTNAKKRNQISHFIKITKDCENLLQYLRKYTN